MGIPLRERLLTLFFAAVLLLNVGYVLLGVASIPRYYERVTTLTIQDLVPGANAPTNEAVQRSALGHGLTLSAYALEQIVFDSVLALVFLAVAALIVARVRWHWFAWYSASFLVSLAGYALFTEVSVANLVPPSMYESGVLFWPLVLLYLFLFPNGKPVPRRGLWLILPAVVLLFLVLLLGYLAILSTNAAVESAFARIAAPAEVVITVVFVGLLGCQVYRYVRVSSREEKQQTKWFVFGFVLFLALSVLNDVLGTHNPYRDEVGLLIFAFVPVSVGVAILRYRLWDIDLLIRRTLVYGTLTVLLVLTYAGLVIGLGSLLRLFTGELGQSPVVIVVSTLAIAALFQPLRHRLQAIIDRRFYRRKYDAAQTLAAFNATLRQGVDLEQLREHLLAVVQETMQPAHVSLWLRPPVPDRKQQTAWISTSPASQRREER
jgi:hypothetical protein